MRDSKMLLRLLRLHLQSDPPCAAVLAIALSADPSSPRSTQGGLFLPSSPDPQKLELTLARLANLVGDANIGSPHLLDTHRPDAFQMRRFVPSGDATATEPLQDNAPSAAPVIGFRTFRPAPPATVELREGRPVRISFRGMRGDVVAASGPWRSSGEWWRKDAWQQDEWDLEIHFVVFSSRPQTAAAIAALSPLLSTRCKRAGSCAESTIDVHRTPRPLRFQLSRRRFDARGTCGRLRRTAKCAAMALLDRDGVYGSPRFHLAAKKFPFGRTSAPKSLGRGWRYRLLVESRAGYQNLCRLITRMKLRAPKRRRLRLARRSRRMQPPASSASPEATKARSRTPSLKEESKPPPNAFDQLCEQFGRENVYVELQRHFCREEEARNQAAVEIARKLQLPLLATNGVCHAQPPQREVLDVFTCIRHHRTLATAGRLLARNSERHLKSPAEMARLFADLPEAIANTQILSSRLKFTLNDLGYEFPKYPVPEGEIADAISARAHARRHDLALRRRDE